VSRKKSAESSNAAENSKKPAAARPGRKPQKQATAQPKKPKGADLATSAQPDTKEEQLLLLGKLATSPSLNASAVMEPFQKNIVGKEVTCHHLREAVAERVRDVWDGNLQGVEALLMAQAISLQTIYTSLARKAAAQEYMKQYQVHLTLALKAQAQSRATLEALIELKQPRHAPTFIKQANMANGPQQVNNGAAPTAQPLTHAAETASAPSKLLEADASPTFEYVSKGVNEHERLEQRAARAPG
jgi:hypothetical protein